MADDGDVFSLPARPGTADLEALRRALCGAEDRPVTILARDWRRFDSLTLQFLIALQADWRARGLTLRLAEVPPDIAGLFRQIGLHPDLLNWEDAA